MVSQSTDRRSGLRYSTGISWELLGRMMRRRAMSYSRIAYLPTGRMTPLEHWYDKGGRGGMAEAKVEPLLEEAR